MQAFDRMIPVSPGVVSGVGQSNQVPSWMVKILDYTESGVDRFNDYSVLKGFYAKTSRNTDLAGKADLLSSNVLRHSHVVLYIPRGNLQTKLENHLYQSIPIDKITLVNIAQMNGGIETLQAIDYEQCYVQQIEPVLDWILVEFKITKYSNTLFKYDNAGRLLGKDMTSMDYTLNPKNNVNVYQAMSYEEDMLEQENEGYGDHEEDESANQYEIEDFNHEQFAINKQLSSFGEEIAFNQENNPTISAVKLLVGNDKQALANAVNDVLGANLLSQSIDLHLEDSVSDNPTDTFSKKAKNNLLDDVMKKADGKVESDVSNSDNPT